MRLCDYSVCQVARVQGVGIFGSFYRVVSGSTVASGGRDVSSGRAFRGGIRWRSVLLVGALVGVAPYVVSIFLINLYATTEHLANTFLGDLVEGTTGSGGVSGFGVFMARFGTPFLSLAFATGGAMFVGRKVGASATLHGVLIGAVAVVAVHLITVPFFGPPEPYELFTYPAVFIGGAIVGGMKGWEIRTGEEALHRANRAVGVAQSPGDIVRAVGENLTGSNVNGVSLWTLERDDSGGFEPLSSWPSRETCEPPPEAGFGPSRELARLGSPVRLRVGSLSGSGRAAWERRGVKSALLLPLSEGNSSVGLLMITSGKGRGFSKRDERAYSTVAATATLVLENLRLIEAARLSGERAGVLDERQRLAHEIHDTLAQGFTSIVTNLEAAEGSLAADAKTRRHLGNARLIARESLTEARRLVWALRPGQLKDAPLPEAIRTLTEKWSAEAGVPAKAVVTGDAHPLPAAVEATALRIAQEALVNIEKHANAGRAALTLSYMPEGIILDVRDDGVGFEAPVENGISRFVTPANDGSGFGLQGMRERVEKIGGHLSIESEPGEGVALSAEIPVFASEVASR